MSLFRRLFRMFLLVLVVCPPAWGESETVKPVFNLDGAVLDFGVQPVSFPDVMITEVMKRDRILHEALSSTRSSVRQHPYFKGNDILPFLRDNQLEAAVFGDMPTLRAAAEHEILIVALVKQSFSSVVAGKFMQARDLKGKRIAYGQGSTAHYALLECLSSAGLTERDVTLIPMEVSDMPAALEKGEVDAFSAWEPAPTIALSRHPQNSVVYRGLNMSFLVMAKAYADAHPHETRQFAAAFIRAINWMRSNRRNLESAAAWALKAGFEFSGKPPGLSAEQAAAITRKEVLDVPSAPVIPANETGTQGTLFKEFQFLKKQGKLSAQVEWDKISRSFALGLTEELYANPSKYRLKSFDYTN